MKKVLAIVLALVMAFSFAGVASAVDISAGQIYFGPEGNVTADPGETVDIGIVFIGECLDEYDTEGTLKIPFIISVNSTDAVLAAVELTDEAKAVGAELIFDDGEESGLPDISEDALYTGTVTLPASYLYGSTQIKVLNAKIAVSEEWEVVDYVAVNEISVGVSYGYNSFYGLPVVVCNEDGETEVYDEAIEDVAVIVAKPYQPSFFDKAKEWLKEKTAFVLQLIITGLTFVINEYLQPADWNVKPSVE